MASLQVRDVPEPIYRKLKELARKEHRSLAQEAVAVLERGLGGVQDPKAKRKLIIEEIDAQPPIEGSAALTKPSEMIRQDRDAR